MLLHAERPVAGSDHMSTDKEADSAIARFLDATWMERGLSTNTLASYRSDLTALAR
jgi:integrase/recombinase XerD